MPTIQKDISLKQYSTYAIGGSARYFVEIENENDLQNALIFAKENHLQIFVLGGGSNLIIADKGFDGLVIKIQATSYKLQATRVEAGAGISMADLVTQTTEQGLAGLEWAGGLPGSLGGAIFGNAGCFGSEIKDIVEYVTALKITDKDLRLMRYDLRECGFSYRSSVFKWKGDYVIFSAMLKFQNGDAKKLKQVAHEKMAYRKNRHPLEYPNIGSIFKNIDDAKLVENIARRFPELADKIADAWHGKIPTAVLIEKAGLQGKQIGGAQVSEKHANFIINKNNALALDVVTLIKLIKQTVRDSFGIDLVEEVRYVGFD